MASCQGEERRRGSGSIPCIAGEIAGSDGPGSVDIASGLWNILDARHSSCFTHQWRIVCVIYSQSLHRYIGKVSRGWQPDPRPTSPLQRLHRLARVGVGASAPQRITYRCGIDRTACARSAMTTEPRPHYPALCHSCIDSLPLAPPFVSSCLPSTVLAADNTNDDDNNGLVQK
jgi:hypothetical protein